MARFLGEKCTTAPYTRQERFQRHKERMGRLIFFMINGKPSPDTDKKELRNLRNQAKHHVWDTYKQELYYVGKGNVRKKVVTDIDETVELLQQYHTAPMGGHSGINSTLAKISLHYTWNMMKEDITEYISSCDHCQFHSKLKTKAPELKCIKVVEALELVGMDFIGPLPTTEKCHRYVLTFTDYYTMFVDLYPLKDKTAAGVANCIRTFVCRWGAPRRLLSDQGPEFVAEITTEACRSFNITTPVTRASHPQTNGLDERTNQTLKMRLSKLVNEHPTDWDTFLEDLAYSVRTQNQATTKYSPFFLMFGRHPRPTREMDSGDEPHEGLPTAPEVKLDEMVARRQEVIAVVKQHLSELGKGAGKGGGGGEAGGALGKREAVEEELDFRHKEHELLAALRVHHQEEIDHHQKEIERLQREIDRHKGKIRKLHI